MSETDLMKTDFKNKILYPACVLFFAIVLMYFLMAMWADMNVTETDAVITQIYDGENNSNEVTGETKAPSALPVQTLLGIFMFSLSIMALNLIFKMNGSKMFLQMLHYLGSLLAFFIFVLSLSGFISEDGIFTAIVACLFFSIVYFVAVGLVKLFKKLAAKLPEKLTKNVVTKYIPSVFAGFTLIVFGISLFALITNLSVIVRVHEDRTFIADKVLENVYITVVTPMAPTIQNYLRYLASSAVFVAGYAILFTKLHKIVKVALNFLILATGYTLIWLIGFDYFRLISAHLVPAIVIFLSVYLVCLVATVVYLFVKRRKAEETEDYDNQFLPGKKRG